MRSDLDDVCASLEQTKLGAAEKAALQARAASLRAEIETQEDVGADFKAIFPDEPRPCRHLRPERPACCGPRGVPPADALAGQPSGTT